MRYKLTVFGFRTGDFSHITDANYISEIEKRKLKKSKVLVLNALRREPHISHFTMERAIELVNEFEPEKSYFTNISQQLGLHANVQIIVS